MSPNEAIGALKLINLKGVHPFYDWEEMLEVRNVAINALEKQIPKKPRYVDTRFRHHGRKISDGSSLINAINVLIVIVIFFMFSIVKNVVNIAGRL